MLLVKKKACTPSQRHLVYLKNPLISKKPYIKNKIKTIKNHSGKNNSGKITVRHKSIGHKKLYRKIDFYRKLDSESIVVSIEYDPNRGANIAAIYDVNSNNFSYMLAPLKLKVGDIVKSGKHANLELGHTLALSRIPVGSYIHNICKHPKQKAKYSRAAGTYSKIIDAYSNKIKIKISSKAIITLNNKCLATLGIVSNNLKFLIKLGKAGRARWLGRRPEVRGVAMNPVDHPHGGGEGKKSGKGKTPWGKKIK